MSSTPGPAEPADVSALITRTVNDVNRARLAFDKAKLTAKHVENLARAQINSAWLMAYYTDGLGYGTLDDEVIEVLWDCGELATHLLEKIMAIEATTQLPPVRLGPGLYRLTRRINAEPTIEHSVECHNPAFGMRILDEWEQKCRAALAQNAARRQQKAKAA